MTKIINKQLKFGMCFAREFEGLTPLSHIGPKLPVYLELLTLCQKQGWEVFVVTYKTYKGNGMFDGAWLFTNNKFERVIKPIKIDLVFDWVGNLNFPPKKFDPPSHKASERRSGLKVVNVRKFKELTCDKWAAYKLLKDYMPKTFWVKEYQHVHLLLDQISTDIIALKPFNGLRGRGIYIGVKDGLKDFIPDKVDTKYILQEFVDTSNGIPGITSGKHDLRIVVINGKVVWCHVRVPPSGKLIANRAQGGNLTEVDYTDVPASIKKIVNMVSTEFYTTYDNPMFSLDFGVSTDDKPYIFEINDQIGFPGLSMKSKDIFLTELVANFASKM